MTYMQGMVNLAHVVTGTGRAQYWRSGPRHESGAWVFTPLSAVPYSRFWPFDTSLAAEMAYKTCMPSIRSQVLRSGFSEPDVIWTANPGSSALRTAFPNAKVVFQVVDYYPAFIGGNIKGIEGRDYRLADHILVIGDTLKHYITQDHGIDPDKITVLGQGVFSENYSPELPAPEDIAGLPSPLAVWVGVIDKCDPAMFGAVASSLKARGGSLVMIGPRAAWADELATRCENVHLLGSRTPEQVPSYLCNADIGLMLYDQSRQEVYKGQNPLKLYEYAAAGLPVISTDHDEYKFLNAPAIVIRDSSEVEDAIQRAIDECDTLRERGADFIKDRSWHSVYDRARYELERVVVGL